MYSSPLSTSVLANPISCSIHEAQQPGALVIAATLFPWPSHLSTPPQVPSSHCLSSVLPCCKLLSDVHLSLILLAAFDILSNPTTCQLGHQPMSRPAALSQALRFPLSFTRHLKDFDTASTM